MPDRRPADPAEARILVLAPIGRDGVLACGVLQEAGMVAEDCADGEDVLRHAQSGVGALVLTEEVVGTADMPCSPAVRSLSRLVRFPAVSR